MQPSHLLRLKQQCCGQWSPRVTVHQEPLKGRAANSGLGTCPSSKFSGEADGAGLGTDFERFGFRTTAWSLVINTMKSTHNQREPARAQHPERGGGKPEGGGKQQPASWHFPLPEGETAGGTRSGEVRTRGGVRLRGPGLEKAGDCQEQQGIPEALEKRSLRVPGNLCPREKIST